MTEAGVKQRRSFAVSHDLLSKSRAADVRGTNGVCS